jgi:hypothetical protein
VRCDEGFYAERVPTRESGNPTRRRVPDEEGREVKPEESGRRREVTA